MYDNSDIKNISGKLTKNIIITSVVLALLVAMYVIAIVAGIRWLMMLFGALIFIELAYAIIAYIWPNACYLRFLKDMDMGLTRELTGNIVSIAENAETQDGVRVLPVHLLLAEEQDERIIYLNISKKEMFPDAGSDVHVQCYGRHIKAVVQA